jgi:hypothetical protein
MEYGSSGGSGGGSGGMGMASSLTGTTGQIFQMVSTVQQDKDRKTNLADIMLRAMREEKLQRDKMKMDNLQFGRQSGFNALGYLSDQRNAATLSGRQSNAAGSNLNFLGVR